MVKVLIMTNLLIRSSHQLYTCNRNV